MYKPTLSDALSHAESVIKKQDEELWYYRRLRDSIAREAEYWHSYGGSIGAERASTCLKLAQLLPEELRGFSEALKEKLKGEEMAPFVPRPFHALDGYFKSVYKEGPPSSQEREELIRRKMTELYEIGEVFYTQEELDLLRGDAK